MNTTHNPVINWLLDEGWQISDRQEFTKALALCYQQAGVSVARIRLTIRLLHPQVMGFGYTWNANTDDVGYFEATHEMIESEIYLNSPFAAIFEDGASAIRRKIHDPNVPLDYPILKDLKEEGLTDYVALPLIFSDGRKSAITFASLAPNGFTTDELTIIYDSLACLSRIVENQALRHTASVLLETYLGKETGGQVLSGKVKRGDGQKIRSIIWFSDLRQSTFLAESLNDEDFLELLNAYFDCTAGAVIDNGGEVLRYIGDSVLAIFPMGETDQCHLTHKAALNAEKAVRDALIRVQALNENQRDTNKPEIKTGVGLHVGEVMYGNIGTETRLEFSVIGSSANEAARMENMTKELDVPLIVSDEFSQLHGGDWKSLGNHALKGLANKRKLFTFAN